MTQCAAAWFTLLLCSLPLGAREYFVAPGGSDANPGTRAKPFRTLTKAASAMRNGDVCYVRAGTYRETVRLRNFGNISGAYTRFVAYPGERVILSGAEPVNVRWTLHSGHIYKASFPRYFNQLFVDGEMMTEARWPNCPFADRWKPACWATVQPGSEYGKIVDPALTATAKLQATVQLVRRELAEMGMRIEKHYGRPQDIEWAIDRDLPFPDNIFSTQSRPVTAAGKSDFGKDVSKEEGKSDTDHIIDLMLKGFAR